MEYNRSDRRGLLKKNNDNPLTIIVRNLEIIRLRYNTCDQLIKRKKYIVTEATLLKLFCFPVSIKGKNLLLKQNS